MTVFSERQTEAEAKAGPIEGDLSPPSSGSKPVPTLPRVAQGDRLAMSECINRHSPLVWSLARRFCDNTADAEDLVQDVFIELWKNASRFNPALASETTFVAMITRRRLVDRGRKLRSRPMPEPLPESLAAAPASFAIDDAEDVARAAEALGQLRDEQRQVLTLALRDGLTYEQISKNLGAPLGTVKTHARRGMIRLREILHQTPVDPRGAAS